MAISAAQEAGWIQAARGGDLEAFNRLVLAHQDRVYSLAYRIMGDSASAADAAQEAFINAWRRLETYRGGAFQSWLLRITANTCYDALRYSKRRPATGLDDLPGAESDDGPPLVAADLTPEQALQQRELAQAIQQCINALQPDQRMVLVLCDVQEMSYQEVAESNGMNLGTVKSRLSRARAAVRQCLGAVAELLPGGLRQKERT
jgi:RNA polymerase sigma-70 factor (ECF subfamily)